MTDLPQRFTALVAKRPELAVPGLAYNPRPFGAFQWRHNAYPFTDDEASALIFRRLCEALPDSHALLKHKGEWYVSRALFPVGAASPDPLSAIFAYYEAT